MTPGQLRVALSVLAAAAVAAIGLAEPALAQRCDAPPGTAAIEQYCELVPDATGERVVRDAAAPRQPVPAATLQRLERAGADGRALGALLGPRPAPHAAARRPPAARCARTDPRDAHRGGVRLRCAAASERECAASGRRCGIAACGAAAPSAGGRGGTARGGGCGPAPGRTTSHGAWTAAGATLSGAGTVGAGFICVLLAIVAFVGGAAWARRAA